MANALAAGSRLGYVSYRDHTPLSGGQVDDTPFGGGAGMVLRVDVVDAALRGHYGRDPVELRSQRRIVALTPGGRLLDDALVDELAAEPGADAALRAATRASTSASSSTWPPTRSRSAATCWPGGELAAMVVCDAVMRKLPGALGHEDSALEESFSPALEGAPEYPHYTRPAEYRGWRGARGAALRATTSDPRVAARAERPASAAGGGRTRRFRYDRRRARPPCRSRRALFLP